MRISTRTHETVEYMSSALDSMQIPGSEIHEEVFGAFLSRKRKRVEGRGGYFVRDGLRLFLGQVSERAERAGTAVPVERSLARVLNELFGGSGCLQL